MMKELEAQQREGYLAMSKARVTMGVHAITQMQYPPTMAASAVVAISEDSEDIVPFTLVHPSHGELAALLAEVHQQRSLLRDKQNRLTPR